MRFTTAVLGALAALTSLAQAQEYFYVSDFSAYHSPASNYTLVSFNLSFGTEPSTTDQMLCIGTKQTFNGALSTGLAQFKYVPCVGADNPNNSVFDWSLTKNAQNRWVFSVLTIDNGGSYTFPANAETTFFVPASPFGYPKNETYSRLTAPGDKFRVIDIDAE